MLHYDDSTIEDLFYCALAWSETCLFFCQQFLSLCPEWVEDNPEHKLVEDNPEHKLVEDNPEHKLVEDNPEHKLVEDNPEHKLAEDNP